MINDTVLLSKQKYVAIVTLNRPDFGNAHDGQMGEALDATWQHLKEDENIRVVILTAAGTRHFCTGADMKAATRQSQPGFQGRGVTPWGDIPMDFWKPVVCAINGVCAGGGWHFYWQSDFAIASETATFLEPHVSVGWVPLREMLGLANRAPLSVVLRMALMGTAERVSAQRAYELGIITEVVPQERLIPRAVEIAEVIAKQAPLAVCAVKEALHRAYELRFVHREIYEHMGLIANLVAQSEDHKEGPRAFAEKRQANWTGKLPVKLEGRRL